MTWEKAGHAQRRKMLLDGTGPKPIPPLSDEGRKALLDAYKTDKKEWTGGLSWVVLYDDGSTMSKRAMPCWGELVSSAMPRVSRGRKVAGLLVDIGGGHAERKKPWYEFVNTSGLWLTLPNVTEPVSSSAFILRDLNWPATLLINYLIALRIPTRNHPVVHRWLEWRELGVSPLGSFLMSSFLSMRPGDTHAYGCSEKYEYPLTGFRLVENTVSLSRVANRSPLLHPSFAFSTSSRGIPNNIIWETRGKSEHFLTKDEVQTFKQIGSYRRMFSSDQAIDIAKRLEAALKSKSKAK